MLALRSARMLTKEENEMLTRVEKGTPMGEFFRKYWLPVGISADLKTKPTFIRALGEDLVLYRDRSGTVGLLDARCAHRRANLCLGTAMSKGLMCRYHGWVFDADGTVLQTPSEASDFRLSIKQKAYPVQERGGLVFAYMGAPPVPLLPNFDFLAAEGERHVKITGVANCNWLQCVENGIDPLHVSFLHADVWDDLEVEPEMGFTETRWGLVHKAYRPGKPGVWNYREHHLLMPGISAGGSQGRNLVGNAGTPPISCRWSVPIDDFHSLIIRLVFKPADNPGTFTRDPIARAWKALPIEPYQEYTEKEGNEPPELGYTMASVIATEDATIIESLGDIVDRENEHLLPLGDYGIIALRKLYLEQVKAVMDGKDPMGVVRDPTDNELHVIPAWEYDVTEEEFKTSMAAATASSSDTARPDHQGSGSSRNSTASY
jgi:5,5'-dehydrodivanillate O-demethylase oxygenase subunit